MKIIKILFTGILFIFLLLWGLKYTSTNLMIEGYSGLIFEHFFPNHDTEFSKGYSDEGFLKIKEGMMEIEVINLLGEPICRWEPKDNYVGFQYSQSKGSTHYRLRQVYLSEGEVKEIIGYYYID